MWYIFSVLKGVRILFDIGTALRYISCILTYLKVGIIYHTEP